MFEGGPDRLATETARSIEILRAGLADAADLAAVPGRIASDDVSDLLVNNAGMPLVAAFKDKGVCDQGGMPDAVRTETWARPLTRSETELV